MVWVTVIKNIWVQIIDNSKKKKFYLICFSKLGPPTMWGEGGKIRLDRSD